MKRLLLWPALAALFLVAPSAHAADFGYGPAGFSFDGLYLGPYLGGAISPSDTDGTIGGAVGVHFTGMDPLVTGAEIQGGVADHNSKAAYDLLALGHLGVLVTNDIMAYGALGGGVDTAGSTHAVWSAGGGAAIGITDSLSARGEALYMHEVGGSANKTKVTAGLMWHLR